MRFSYAETMCDPAFYVPLARAAEEAGYSTYLVPDSICYPEESDTSYPYTGDGDRRFLEGKPFIDPFVLVGAMGAVTARIRFATFVLKLPVRSPVLVAKAVTSLAVLTNERFSLGVGTSPWPEDFQVTFESWKTRGARTNEMIEIIRGLDRGSFFEFTGKHYQLPKIKLCPTPTAPVPILVGGHSDAALRRAARLANGWMHAGGDTSELANFMKRLDTLRAEYGRESEPFEIHAASMDGFHLDGVRRLEDLGVTDLVLAFRNPYSRQADTETLQTKLDALRRYADDVIAKA